MEHTRLRRPAVLERLKIGTTKLYYLMRYDGFPAPIKLGRASVWSEEEIEAWLAKQMEKRNARRKLERETA